MTRKSFFSFHYEPDVWRVSQVRNIGLVEGNQPASDNDWEAVKKGGERAIEAWIATQMSGRTCTVVLIGENTAKRKWIDYEITKAWNDGMGVVGVYIHNLKNANGDQSRRGVNPFAHFTVGIGKQDLSTVVKAYDPPMTDSRQVYDHIASNLSSWIEDAVAIRNNYGK